MVKGHQTCCGQWLVFKSFFYKSCTGNAVRWFRSIINTSNHLSKFIDNYMYN